MRGSSRRRSGEACRNLRIDDPHIISSVPPCPPWLSFFLPRALRLCEKSLFGCGRSLLYVSTTYPKAPPRSKRKNPLSRGIDNFSFAALQMQFARVGKFQTKATTVQLFFLSSAFFCRELLLSAPYSDQTVRYLLPWYESCSM